MIPINSRNALAEITSESTVIQINNVGLTYQTDKQVVTALQNINLQIKEGSFVCVLGPSGCGKTTLLRILAGFHQATSGEVLLDNEPISPKPDRHRGVVFQQQMLYPWLNIEENVGFGLKMRKVPMKERQEIVDHYLEMVGLSQFKKSKSYELSGGMKQRASIARVLANDPRIVLMDEPFGALDALTRTRLQEELKLIAEKTRVTIFFVTHSIEEAVLLADRIIVLTHPPSYIAEIVNVSDKAKNLESDESIEIQQHLRKLLGS